MDGTQGPYGQKEQGLERLDEFTKSYMRTASTFTASNQSSGHVVAQPTTPPLHSRPTPTPEVLWLPPTRSQRAVPPP